MLYPKLNKFRDVYSLSGIWKYNAVEEDYIPTNPLKEFGFMAVPASINDIVTDIKIKNHVGKFVFETEFSIPQRDELLYNLRIGAVSHKCEVYLNGKKIGNGLSGFFPIDLPLDNLEEKNRISIVVDNRLTFETLPVGKIENGKQIITFDFYNFTGIHRNVEIYSRPKNFIEDVEIKTVVDGDYSKIKVVASGKVSDYVYTVLNADNQEVMKTNVATFNIANPVLWCPENPYLYKLVVENGFDKIEETFGIRKVEVVGDKLLLNGKQVYLKGFGMHEDFFIIGKGACEAVNIRNFECLKWCNANSFRTSHYPYSEDIMDLADKYGFMVIDEVPAVGMNWWKENFGENGVNEKTKELHKELIKQLYERDKNHPSVIMLDVSNEPGCQEEKSVPYFKDIFDYARNIWDVPLTLVSCMKPEQTEVAKFCDMVSVNRYWGWYENHGDVSVIKDEFRKDIKKWHELYKKPILISEFGADTIEGLHALPEESFSEEYQYECLKANCEAMDEFNYCIGEHVWNFADFKTKQGLTRVRGNRKGVFTKDRQPKFAAHYLKERWSKK